MSMFSDYLENKLIDQLFRNQPYTFPSTLYVALFTASPSDTGGGTEVSTSGTAYARVAVANALANWAGTQAPGSTLASSGNTGTTSNNTPITFPAPLGSNWGVITAIGIFDAVSGGNLLIWGPLTAPKTVNAGDAAPSFPAGTLQLQIDN